jgi:hypothetical protein
MRKTPGVWGQRHQAGGRKTSLRSDLLDHGPAVNNNSSIDFEGHNYEIATTLRKSVSIIHHPNRKFRVVKHPPKAVWLWISATFRL